MLRKIFNKTYRIDDLPIWYEDWKLKKYITNSEKVTALDVMLAVQQMKEQARKYHEAAQDLMAKLENTIPPKDGVKQELSEYEVKWIMTFEGLNPRDAAERALDIHRDPTSIATCFTVTNTKTGQEVDVDLSFEED